MQDIMETHFPIHPRNPVYRSGALDRRDAQHTSASSRPGSDLSQQSGHTGSLPGAPNGVVCLFACIFSLPHAFTGGIVLLKITFESQHVQHTHAPPKPQSKASLLVLELSPSAQMGLFFRGGTFTKPTPSNTKLFTMQAAAAAARLRALALAAEVNLGWRVVWFACTDY